MTNPASEPTTHPLTSSLLVLYGAVDASTINQNDLNDWWTNEHLPERLRLPGFEHARRYRRLSSLSGPDGQTEYLALYSVTHLSQLASNEYAKKLENPTPRTMEFMPCLAGMTRVAGNVVMRASTSQSLQVQRAAGTGYYLGVLEFATGRSGGMGEEAFTEAILHEILQLNAADIAEILLVQEDVKITQAGSKSKSYKDVQFSKQDEGEDNVRGGKCIMLFEFKHLGDARIHKMKSLYEDTAKMIEESGGKAKTGKTFELIVSTHSHAVLSPAPSLAHPIAWPQAEKQKL